MLGTGLLAHAASCAGTQPLFDILNVVAVVRAPLRESYNANRASLETRLARPAIGKLGYQGFYISRQYISDPLNYSIMSSIPTLCYPGDQLRTLIERFDICWPVWQMLQAQIFAPSFILRGYQDILAHGQSQNADIYIRLPGVGLTAELARRAVAISHDTTLASETQRLLGLCFAPAFAFSSPMKFR